MASTRSEPRLSPSEKAILTLIPKTGVRVSTKVLTARHYGRHPPFHARIVVAGVVRALVKKSKMISLGGRVRSTKRSGPHPIEVWWEKGR